MIDLYCLGGASVDLILEAPHFPRDGEKLFVDFAGQLAHRLQERPENR